MNVFAYGTLMWPEVLEAVTGLQLAGEPHTLMGYKRLRVKGEIYPVIVPSAGDSVDGVLYQDVDVSALGRLDVFEGEAYNRIIESISGTDAWVYVLSDRWRHIADSKCWFPEQLTQDQLAGFMK